MSLLIRPSSGRNHDDDDDDDIAQFMFLDEAINRTSPNDVTFGVTANSRVEEVLRHSNVSLFKQLWHRIQHASPSGPSIVRDVTDALRRVRRRGDGGRRFVLVTESLEAAYLASKEPCDLVALDQFLPVVDYSLFVIKQESSSPLLGRLNAALRELERRNVLSDLLHKWLSTDFCRPREGALHHGGRDRQVDTDRIFFTSPYQAGKMPKHSTTMAASTAMVPEVREWKRGRGGVGGRTVGTLSATTAPSRKANTRGRIRTQPTLRIPSYLKKTFPDLRVAHTTHQSGIPRSSSGGITMTSLAASDVVRGSNKSEYILSTTYTPSLDYMSQRQSETSNINDTTKARHKPKRYEESFIENWDKYVKLKLDKNTTASFDLDNFTYDTSHDLVIWDLREDVMSGKEMQITVSSSFVVETSERVFDTSQQIPPVKFSDRDNLRQASQGIPEGSTGHVSSLSEASLPHKYSENISQPSIFIVKNSIVADELLSQTPMIVLHTPMTSPEIVTSLTATFETVFNSETIERPFVTSFPHDKKGQLQNDEITMESGELLKIELVKESDNYRMSSGNELLEKIELKSNVSSKLNLYLSNAILLAAIALLTVHCNLRL